MSAEPDAAEVSRRLIAAPAHLRHEVIHGLINDHPESRLRLPGGPEARPDLRDVSLGGVRLRMASMAYCDLHRADLKDSHLARADLREACLERADARGADLSGACLVGAAMGEANLEEALLEDADLTGASLRFAKLGRAVLESAKLDGADLWGVNLTRASLNDASVRGAQAGEASAVGADFSGADLRDSDWTRANLARAKLRDADLRGAVFKDADLEGAVLAGARLEGANLSSSALAGAHWADARLDKTRLSVSQLGGATGEDLARDWDAAGRAYLTLERNFVDLGDATSASWAYRRRRRMEKRAAGRRAVQALAARDWRPAVVNAVRYAGAQLVEGVCDYGESLGRVFLTLVVVYLGFAFVYGATGSVDRMVPGAQGSAPVVTRQPIDLAIFSLMAMTNSNGSATLSASHLYVNLLTGAQTLTTVFLTGLLGFVAGNRIRR